MKTRRRGAVGERSKDHLEIRVLTLSLFDRLSSRLQRQGSLTRGNVQQEEQENEKKEESGGG